MGNRQSKRNKKTKESPRRDKLTKKRRKEVKYEPSEVLTQRTSGASSRGHGLQAPTLLSVVIEPKSLKKDATIADRSEPQTATTEQASPLSLEPSKATTSALNVAECDDKIRRLKDFQPGASHSIKAHPVTTTQALPLNLGPIA